jgi:NAD(P)H dehydrogenase (quinone)
MTPVNVLVVFYSRHGGTERLAMNAGVGAMQGRASVRLRRLPDLASEETIAADARWAASAAQMRRDYIAPHEIDAEWAEVLILAAPEAGNAEMQRYLESLHGMEPRIAALFTPASIERPSGTAPANGGDQDLSMLITSAVNAGLTVVAGVPGPDAAAAAREYGRRVTEMARALKQSSPPVS